MKCEHCHQNEATVHLTQVAEGQVKKLHLCEQCAKEMGMDFEGPMAMADLVLGLGQPSPEKKSPETSACPQCHLTRADFKKTGRLGCPYCYEHFRAELTPMIKAMHHGERHVGKRPPVSKARTPVPERLAELRRRLEEAVAAEQYEAAAALRDEIRALTEGHSPSDRQP